MDAKLNKLLAFKRQREMEREAERQKIYARLKEAPEAVRDAAFVRDEKLRVLWEEMERISQEQNSFRKGPEISQSNRNKKTSVYDSRPAWDVTVPPEVEQPQSSASSQRALKKIKTRDKSIVISLSEEEKVIITNYTRKKGIKLSLWVRTVLFDAMGTKIPSRPSD